MDAELEEVYLGGKATQKRVVFLFVNIFNGSNPESSLRHKFLQKMGKIPVRI